MLKIDKQTACTDNAGDHSSVNIDKQMCPFEYMWGCMGTLFPTNITFKVKTLRINDYLINQVSLQMANRMGIFVEI